MFDIDEIVENALVLGLNAEKVSDTRVDVNIGKDKTLVFENTENDTFIGIKNDWHSHGDIMADHLGVELEDVPATILNALKDGRMLLVTQNYASGDSETKIKIKSHISTAQIENLGSGESI